MIFINDIILNIYMKNPVKFNSYNNWISISLVIITALTGFYVVVFPLIIFIDYYIENITEHTKQSLIGMGIFFIWLFYDLVNVVQYGY